MKLFAICALVLATLIVSLWPIAFTMTGFLFDAPAHGPETHKLIVAYAIWAYPVGYLVAIGYVLHAKTIRPGIPWWSGPTAFLFLIPIVHFFLAEAAAFMVMT